MKTLRFILLPIMLLAAAVCSGADNVSLSALKLNGTVTDDFLQFTLELEATALAPNARISLPFSNTALLPKQTPNDDEAYLIRAVNGYYQIVIPKPNVATTIRETFSVRANTSGGDSAWRSLSLPLPEASRREVSISSPDPELAILLPNTIRQKQDVKANGITATAILQPRRAFDVNWKPRVEIQQEAELLFTVEANNVCTVNPGILRMDALFACRIAQGKLRTLRYKIPADLTITQVRGPDIRDWQIKKDAATNDRILTVQLSRDHTSQYVLQILAEKPVTPLPSEVSIPVIEPLDANRAGGFLNFGTDSSLQLVTRDASGLSQIEAAAFPRAALNAKTPRPLPAARSFSWSFAAYPWKLNSTAEDITPSYDVDYRVVADVRDDDLVLDVNLELDIREAPLRTLPIEIPAGFTVAAAEGAPIADHSVGVQSGKRMLEIIFKQPVIGRTTIHLRLEKGDSPVDTEISLGDLRLPSARNERGYLAVSAGEGVGVRAVDTTNLRPVNVRSIPMRVARTELAWRFRTTDWSLKLAVSAKPAAIRAEAFHLVSLGDGVAYGNVSVTYLISGAPVDELRFKINDALENVEFVGVDVTRWYKEDDVWVVKLRRKVLDAYNLGVSWSRRYVSGDQILMGGVACDGVETQTGFISVASHLSLEMAPVSADSALIPIASDEIPNHYRLLVTAPVLASWKYVSTPHVLQQTIATRPAGETPAAIAEFVHAKTNLSITDSRSAESVTTVTFTVKNANAQFLDLKLPPGANAWMARIKQGDRSERVPTAAANGMLKIPLSRGHNPNDPLTIELEYGLDHGNVPFSGQLDLRLPASPIPGAFTDWKVHAPAGWHLNANDTNVAPEGAAPSPLATALSTVARVWERGLQRSAFALLVACVLIVLVPILRNKRYGRIAVPIACVLIAWVAIVGLNRAHIPQPQIVDQVQFHQVLQLDAETLPQISLNLRPAWLRNCQTSLLVLGSVLFLGGLAGVITRRAPRPLSWAAAVIGIAVVLSLFPAGSVALVHLLTWVVPVAFAVKVGCTGRFLPRAAAVAAVCLLAMPNLRAATPTAIIRHAELAVTEEDKALSTAWTLTGESDRILQIPVGKADAVILQRDKDVILTQIDGQLALIVQPGPFTHTFQLLTPLPAPSAKPAGQRTISIPLPPRAVTNSVSFTVNRPGIQIEAPTAAALTTKETADSATAQAVFPPGSAANFVWRPRIRSTAEEKTVFYAESATLATADVGMVATATAFSLRVAQGRLQRVSLLIPKGTSVTQAVGAKLGTWRFDPVKSRLELRFTEKLSGDVEFLVAAQMTAPAMPYKATLQPIIVEDAQRPRASLGVRPTNDVQLQVTSHPARMSPEDFVRASRALKVRSAPPHTYRMTGDAPAVKIDVAAVLPEVRVQEQASFSVGDDRLVLSSSLLINVSRTGRFDLPLVLPPGYDIDTVEGAQVSHWDEFEKDGARTVMLNFAKSLMGDTRVAIALSRPLRDDTGPLEVPRITVTDAVKHTGQLVVSAARGTRLGILERDGVSELDPAQLKLANKPALAFRILRPQWRLSLSRETLIPRVQVDYLHLANVSDGIIRHTQYRRYRLQHAGTKILVVQVPENVLGLTITGPDIARREPLENGQWRVELADKWFDREYPLRVSYETKFDPSSTSVPIEPMDSVGADLQRGFVVVLSSNRVELQAASGDSLQTADARNVPTNFGAGDLSGAVFCYRCNLPTYDLAINAKRHDEANLLTAEVRSVTIDTVVNRGGDAITRVAMKIAAGRRRHLAAQLPPSASVWSLLVDRQARRPANGDNGLLLIPLPQDETGSLEVAVDLVYVTPGSAFSGKTTIAGPRFDLPLRDVKWNLHLPPDRRYADFTGTMSIADGSQHHPSVRKYDLSSYNDKLLGNRVADLQQAQQLQAEGIELANKGNQQEARQKLEQAYNYSQADRSLNEDARVVLRNLLRQQAVVGLVQRRDGIRQLDKQGYDSDWQAKFTNDQAERLQSGLSRDDNNNLKRITDRVVEYQEAAADTHGSLMVTLPMRGIQVHATRALQVNPSEPMEISFTVSQPPSRWSGSLLMVVIPFLGLAFLLFIADRVAPKWDLAMARTEAKRASRGRRKIVFWKKKKAKQELPPEEFQEAQPIPEAVEAGRDGDGDAEAESDFDAESNTDGDTDTDAELEPEPEPPPLPPAEAESQNELNEEAPSKKEDNPNA